MPIRPPKGFISESDPRVSLIGHPAPPWLVNYADLMTELVCFFVILYALSAALNKDIQQARKDIEDLMAEEKIAGEVTVDKEGMHISLEEEGRSVDEAAQLTGFSDASAFHKAFRRWTGRSPARSQ